MQLDTRKKKAIIIILLLQKIDCVFYFFLFLKHLYSARLSQGKEQQIWKDVSMVERLCPEVVEAGCGSLACAIICCCTLSVTHLTTKRQPNWQLSTHHFHLELLVSIQRKIKTMLISFYLSWALSCKSTLFDKRNQYLLYETPTCFRCCCLGFSSTGSISSWIIMTVSVWSHLSSSQCWTADNFP